MRATNSEGDRIVISYDSVSEGDWEMDEEAEEGEEGDGVIVGETSVSLTPAWLLAIEVVVVWEDARLEAVVAVAAGNWFGLLTNSNKGKLSDAVDAVALNPVPTGPLLAPTSLPGNRFAESRSGSERLRTSSTPGRNALATYCRMDSFGAWRVEKLEDPGEQSAETAQSVGESEAKRSEQVWKASRANWKAEQAGPGWREGMAPGKEEYGLGGLASRVLRSNICSRAEGRGAEVEEEEEAGGVGGRFS